MLKIKLNTKIEVIVHVIFFMDQFVETVDVRKITIYFEQFL